MLYNSCDHQKANRRSAPTSHKRRRSDVIIAMLSSTKTCFEREAGATHGGSIAYRKSGAYDHTARHAVECVG